MLETLDCSDGKKLASRLGNSKGGAAGVWLLVNQRNAVASDVGLLEIENAPSLGAGGTGKFDVAKGWGVVLKVI